MRKFLLPLVLFTAVIFGCNPATNFINKYLNSSNLTEQTFIIRTDKDTTVKTTEGIIISIPANSIKADGNTVTLQIKEALTTADILKAGLTTQAGKDILSSDGMFYIGTKEQSTITGAIHIKLPTANANKNMQLYNGVEKDGKIDWQSPTPIAKTITRLADSGEVLFKANCTSCHAIDKMLTGPALAGMDIRRSRKWDHAFIKNNQRLLECGDEYALALYHQYGSAMTVFEDLLTDRQIDAIIRYVDKASNNPVQPENPNDYLDEDSCKF
jgi:mono/diheme cytochrome c family protein